MKYIEELRFIESCVKESYSKFDIKSGQLITQKSDFDLVTELDYNVEKYLIDCIKNTYPEDNILSEETLHTQKLIDRTWTIDPIDGTCNMAHEIPIYGTQCSLIEDNEIVVSIIYLPEFDVAYTAVIGEGSFKNGKKIEVNYGNTVNNAIVSMGDYSHRNPQNAKKEHHVIGDLYKEIAKIRFWGAACFDFSYVADKKTDGTIMLTKNIWDIAPGILLAKEAGAIVTNTVGESYQFGDEGVVVAANAELSKLLIDTLMKY